jgi:nicotinamidase-related amidase
VTPRTALLVVDVQEAAVGPGLYEGEAVLANIAELVALCRESGVEVVFVQHDGRAGSAYEPGKPGWPIHSAVRPRPDEKVVRKATNSAFRRTDLRSYLEERGVHTLVIVGLHTEFCVDTTCRVAFEHGFDILMPEMTNTTFDNGELTGRQLYELYNQRILRDRFARVPTMDEARALLADANAGSAGRGVGG